MLAFHLFNCTFELFDELTQVCTAAHAGHTGQFPQSGFQNNDIHLHTLKIEYLSNMAGIEIKNIILDSLKQYSPQFIGFFGSYARNEQTDKSDIDILVTFQNGISLLQLIRLEQELSTRLGRKVDLITEGAIKNKRIKDNISNDLQIIFQA